MSTGCQSVATEVSLISLRVREFTLKGRDGRTGGPKSLAVGILLHILGVSALTLTEVVVVVVVAVVVKGILTVR